MNVEYDLDILPILTGYKNKSILDPPGEPPSGVTYVYNDYGYRSFESYEKLLKVKDKIVCIGCSFTFGIGLEYDELWTTHLSLMTNKPVMNLGWAGGSHGYVIWQLLNVLRNVQAQNICVVIPPKGRLFNHTEFYFENINRLEGDNAINTKFVVESAENDDFLLKSLCKYHNVNYIECYQYGHPYDSNWTPMARDNGHFGEKWNKFVANEFRKKII